MLGHCKIPWICAGVTIVRTRGGHNWAGYITHAQKGFKHLLAISTKQNAHLLTCTSCISISCSSSSPNTLSRRVSAMSLQSLQTLAGIKTLTYHHYFILSLFLDYILIHLKPWFEYSNCTDFFRLPNTCMYFSTGVKAIARSLKYYLKQVCCFHLHNFNRLPKWKQTLIVKNCVFSSRIYSGSWNKMCLSNSNT